jgi:hypothetical protein
MGTVEAARHGKGLITVMAGFVRQARGWNMVPGSVHGSGGTERNRSNPDCEG